MKTVSAQELTGIIKKELERKRPLILAVDGRCASGKSTFARELSGVCLAEVIHMDDFFLRPQQRTKERLAEAGGNIDRERFLQEVAVLLGEYRKAEDVVSEKKWNHDTLLTYRRYDCSRQELTDTVQIKRSPLIIVEGAYSCHPCFGDIYDLRVFMDVEDERQRERVKKRNGADMLPRFLEEWIPKENAYFERFCIRENCDYLVLS